LARSSWSESPARVALDQDGVRGDGRAEEVEGPLLGVECGGLGRNDVPSGDEPAELSDGSSIHAATAAAIHPATMRKRSATTMRA
jgi:hypothetical protein